MKENRKSHKSKDVIFTCDNIDRVNYCLYLCKKNNCRGSCRFNDIPKYQLMSVRCDQLFKRGKSQREIARIVGIDKTTVKKALTWICAI